jgi:hypothetical protein
MILARRAAPATRLVLASLFPALTLAACRTARKPQVAGAPESPPSVTPALPPPEVAKGEDPQLVVKKVEEPIVVAAWAEPRALPGGGGQSQLLVRVQKRGGAPFPGVEVRFKASTGSLFSGGKILVTDPLGLTRDRITLRKTATVTLNAGGTHYSFQVPVGE